MVESCLGLVDEITKANYDCKYSIAVFVFSSLQLVWYCVGRCSESLILSVFMHCCALILNLLVGGCYFTFTQQSALEKGFT